MDRDNLRTIPLPGRWPSYAIGCARCGWRSGRCLPPDDPAWIRAQGQARAHECAVNAPA